MSANNMLCTIWRNCIFASLNVHTRSWKCEHILNMHHFARKFSKQQFTASYFVTYLLNSKLNETKMEVLLSLYAAHLRNIIGLLSRPNVWVLIVDVPGKEWNYRSVSGPYLYWHLCSLYGSSCQPVGLETEDCSPILTSLYTYIIDLLNINLYLCFHTLKESII